MSTETCEWDNVFARYDPWFISDIEHELCCNM